jgi:exonuclease VII large subunit
MNVKTIFAAAIFAVASLNAAAQTPTAAKPVSSLKNDKQRINQGVRSGQLTKVEAARLRQQKQDLQQERKDYKLDGISAEERKDLRQDKKALSKKIYRQKHDAQVRH